MLVHTIHLITKIDPLKYLLCKAALIGRLAKWMMILSEFDIEYIERKEIKGKDIRDQLVDFPLQDDAPIQVDFPDEHLMYMTERTWKMFFDGSFMQNGFKVGVYLFLLMGIRFLNLTSYYFHVQITLLSMKL